MNANVLVVKKGHIPFFSERKAARENFRFTFTQVYVVIILLLAVFGVYYVWILNQNATKGYNVRELHSKNHELTIQENFLDIRIAEGQSIDAILASAILQDMQNVENPHFLVMKGQGMKE